ncbi:MAG: PASTA domain-containing protein [Coriobacteriia bacterium]|nr:PASTA domain-containing protein [Coriobacteriia bacterium]
MPKTTVAAAVVITLLIASAATAAVFVGHSRLVEVPDVGSIAWEDAEKAIAEVGLTAHQAGTRVSVEVPVGHVISQDPAAGVNLKPGQTVRVVVSAGPQTFVVPDFIGDPIDIATHSLEALGLTVVAVPMASDTTDAVVLAMYPGPGSSVSPGDEVRLSVPGESSASDILLPYDLSGLTVLIDPLPSPADVSADAPMEIARRLQALLEAAGARVNTTTTGTTAPASPATRIEAARASSASLLIGIDLGGTGDPGIKVGHLPQEDGSARAESSALYATSITRAANLPGLIVSEPAVTNDPVLAAFPGTGIRVVVGDSAADTDRARFTDPAWADQVARAIYRGIGTAFTAQ